MLTTQQTLAQNSRFLCWPKEDTALLFDLFIYISLCERFQYTEGINQELESLNSEKHLQHVITYWSQAKEQLKGSVAATVLKPTKDLVMF